MDRKMTVPPLAMLTPSEVIAPPMEVEVPPDASPLDFLSAIYRDPAQPMARRMRAAIQALPFAHPKLAVTAMIDGSGGFAARLEAARRRSGKVIEAQPGLASTEASDRN